MKSTRFSLVLTLLVTLAACAMAIDYCSPSTCVGVVEKYWEDNLNCQGEPTAIYQSVDTGMENVCDAAGLDFMRTRGSRDGYFFISYFNGSTCSAESFSASQSYRLGQCIRYDTTSMAYLASVNDTATAPGTSDSTVTRLHTEFTECYSPNNCTSDIPIYTTYYDSSTCEAGTAYESAGYIVSANFSYGGCFLDGTHTVKYSCDGATLRTDYYQSGACAGLPYSSEVSSTSCVRTWEPPRRNVVVSRDHHRITCPAAPTVASAPTPTSYGLSVYETKLAWLALTGTTLLSMLL